MNNAASFWPRNKELGGRWQLTGYIAAVDRASPQNRRCLFAFFKQAKAQAQSERGASGTRRAMGKYVTFVRVSRKIKTESDDSFK